MTDYTEKPKVLTSDPDVLHKIKFIQFRRQLYPLIAVIVFMAINIFLPNVIFQYLTIAAFGWYLVERIVFRTKNKILVPEAGAFVSPVNGKVQAVRKSPDATLITLRKSFLDVVELRLPYPDLHSETADNWSVETSAGLVSMRIKSEKTKYFDNKNIHGSVIGVIPGNALIMIHLPASVNVLVNDKQNVFGGETVLFSFAKATEAEPEPKSILVEEPIDELT